MDISGIIRQFGLELQAFFDSPDRRPYLMKRVGVFYDATILPLDLPGPDRLVDPILRSLLSMVVGTIYDAIDKAIQSGKTITWAAAPSPNATNGGDTCD